VFIPELHFLQNKKIVHDFWQSIFQLGLKIKPAQEEQKRFPPQSTQKRFPSCSESLFQVQLVKVFKQPLRSHLAE